MAIVRENEEFYHDFVSFLEQEGYESVFAFIQEPSDEQAANTIRGYLDRHSDVKLTSSLSSYTMGYFVLVLIPGPSGSSYHGFSEMPLHNDSNRF